MPATFATILTLMTHGHDIERLQKEREGAPVSDAKTLQDLERSAKAVRFMDTYATFIDVYGGDALAGLVPALGDGTTTIASLLVALQQAKKVNLPWHDQLAILLEQATDFGIGAIPIVGDLADFFFRSNIMAKDRFAAHFKKELLSAWKDGKIVGADVPTLAAQSGIQITLPSEKNSPLKEAA